MVSKGEIGVMHFMASETWSLKMDRTSSRSGRSLGLGLIISSKSFIRPSIASCLMPVTSGQTTRASAWSMTAITSNPRPSDVA